MTTIVIIIIHSYQNQYLYFKMKYLNLYKVKSAKKVLASITYIFVASINKYLFFQVVLLKNISIPLSTS